MFDGKDQVILIKGSVKNTPAPATSTALSPPRGRSNQENGHDDRAPSPSKKLVKDPYTTLDTFFTNPEEQGGAGSGNHVIAPRAESFKPPPRDMSELFAAGHEDNEPGSPKKSSATPVMAPKAGSKDKFRPVRLFEDEDEKVVSPKIYKTNPARYDHFDIGDEMENDHFQHKSGGKPVSKAAPLVSRTGKHTSQWDFADFTTPHKVAVKVRDQDKVNFSLDNEKGSTPAKQAHAQKPRKDAESSFEIEDDGTPVERKVVPKPRKDNSAHFAFDDEPTPAASRIIARTDAAKGLYRNVMNDEEKPLGEITNKQGKRNDFGSQWDMTDDSPAHTKSNARKGAGHDRQNSTNANWGSYGQSPEQARKPTTSAAFKKGLQPQWGVGDDEEKPTAKAGAGKKGFWDF